MKGDRPQPPGPTLATLACRIADELCHLGALSEQVQTALSRCGLCAVNDREALIGLQGIDRINQGLTDLARLMDAVGAQLDAQIGTEARLKTAMLESRVTLHELALRLFHDGQRPRHICQAVDPAATGEVQLF